MKKSVLSVLVVVILIIGIGGVFGQSPCASGMCQSPQFLQSGQTGMEGFNGISDPYIQSPGRDPGEWNTGYHSVTGEPAPETGGQPLKDDPSTVSEGSAEQRSQVSPETTQQMTNEQFESNYKDLPPDSKKAGIETQHSNVEISDPSILEGTEIRNGVLSNGQSVVDLNSLPQGSKLGMDGAGNFQVTGPNGQTMTLGNGAGGAMGGCASCGGGGSGGGGSGGGGAGGGGEGGGLGGLDEAFQKALSAWGQISGILGQIKEAMGDKGSGEAKPSPFGGSMSEVAVDDGGSAYLGSEGSGEEVAMEQSDPSGGEAVLDFDGGLENMIAQPNTIVSIEEAIIDIPADSEPTTIVNQGADGDFIPGYTGETGSENIPVVILPLFSQMYGITGLVSAPSSSQYVKFIQHDLLIGGRNIIVEIYKSFNHLEGDGSTLWVEDGETKIRFEGRRIFYPRVLVVTPHSFQEIRNKQDARNNFLLRSYGDDNGYIVDGERRLTIGDIMIDHPRLQNLNIAQGRKPMWVER
jgi:hypothetical protein